MLSGAHTNGLHVVYSVGIGPSGYYMHILIQYQLITLTVCVRMSQQCLGLYLGMSDRGSPTGFHRIKGGRSPCLCAQAHMKLGGSGGMLPREILEFLSFLDCV